MNQKAIVFSWLLFLAPLAVFAAEQTPIASDRSAVCVSMFSNRKPRAGASKNKNFQKGFHCRKLFLSRLISKAIQKSAAFDDGRFNTLPFVGNVAMPAFR